MFAEIQHRAPLALKANQISQYYSSSNGQRTYGSGKPIEQYATLSTLADPYQTNLQKQLYLIKNYQQVTGKVATKRKLMRVDGMQTGLEQRYGLIGENNRFSNEELRNLGDLLWRGLTDATRFFSNKSIEVGEINRFPQERFFSGQSKLGSAFKQDLDMSFADGLDLFNDDSNNSSAVSDIKRLNKSDPPGGGKNNSDQLSKSDLVNTLVRSNLDDGADKAVGSGLLDKSADPSDQSATQLKLNPFGFGQYSNIALNPQYTSSSSSSNQNQYDDKYEESKGEVGQQDSSSQSLQQSSFVPYKNLIKNNTLDKVGLQQQATIVAANAQQQQQQALKPNYISHMGYVVDLNNPSVKAAVGKFMSSVQQRLKEANDPEVQKRKAYDLAIEKLDKKDLVDYYGTVSYGSIDDKNYFNIRSKGNVDVDNQGQNLQSLVGMIEQDQSMQAQPGILADLNQI